eukprot:scaffold130394_cov24-Phaeocystis_antarctica.AAC.1
MRLIMNLIMRVFGHYEPLETPNLIMIKANLRFRWLVIYYPYTIAYTLATSVSPAAKLKIKSRTFPPSRLHQPIPNGPTTYRTTALYAGSAQTHVDADTRLTKPLFGFVSLRSDRQRGRLGEVEIREFGVGEGVRADHRDGGGGHERAFK